MSSALNQSDSRPEHSADAEQSTALVFGASGYIGSNLVNLLLKRGEKVRAVARNLAVLEGRQWQGVECMAADALEPESLTAALGQVDTAYYLVHSMAAGSNFGELDLRAAFHELIFRGMTREIVRRAGGDQLIGFS